MPAVGFIAHMDTSPDASGLHVKPQIIRFDGTDVLLNQTEGIRFPVERFPEIKKYIGEDVIFTDGTTLLGADDKSGIAAIMDMAAKITADPKIAHAKLCIAFTPDEEIGRGTANFDLERFGADWAVTIDGGEVGTLENENFNAGSAVVDFQGVGVHPGSSKGKMVNALRMAAAFIDALPADMAPETTEGRQGFLHPNQLEGTVTHAKLHLLIRDHDRALYEEKKVILERITEDIQSRFPNGAVTLAVKESYENMKPYIDRVPTVMEHVRAAYRAAGLEPIEEPIRGGTDGARLSVMGLPCPNVFTGGLNYHGIYECLPVKSLELAAKVAFELAVLSGKK